MNPTAASSSADVGLEPDVVLEQVLELSRMEYEQQNTPVAGSSHQTKKMSVTGLGHGDSAIHLRRQELSTKISNLDTEIRNYDEEIRQLKNLRDQCVDERQGLLQLLGQLRAANIVQGKGKGKASEGCIDYTQGVFSWTRELRDRVKKIFNISSFRLCQEGVCNANMDGRDIVCVMPTGGGKSLTYQLPALLTPGCTLVVSPLISLMADQVFHLRETGVNAVMITGSTSKDEIRRIFDCLKSMSMSGGRPRDTDIKLCYVTPERIAKSRTFMSMLDKLAGSGKLVRFVIDEAHCVSQLGHDYRPDYQKLRVLRQLYPRIPIMALSATCPPRVLEDLLQVLMMKGIVDGSNAKMDGTVYFSAPLYRKNLHYKVVPKPSSSAAVLKTMTDYILTNHLNETGIVYCLTKKDAEQVADGLKEASSGRIKTGVYHADVKDSIKEQLHLHWRQGKVKVVCATIAFGLGIDKGDVRFVLHHSMSKSLDGYYQETGRAGRDGQDADCILYYRPQDAARLSAMVCSEKDGQSKLYDMVRFAQNMIECRKVNFAKVFSNTSQLSMSSWSTEDSSALDRCGHCDNCTRPPESFDVRDVRFEAWQLLKVADVLHREGGRVTMSKLADLCRGSGGGKFDVASAGQKGKRSREQSEIDIKAIAGGKVSLSKEDVEYLVVHLIISGYLAETYHPTAYQTHVYVVPGPKAMRLTRLAKDKVPGQVPEIAVSFGKQQRRGGKHTGSEGRPSGQSSTGTTERQGNRLISDKSIERSDGVEFIDDFDEPATHCASYYQDSVQISDDDGDMDWVFNQRTEPPPKRFKALSNGSSVRINNEVLVLSD